MSPFGFTQNIGPITFETASSVAVPGPIAGAGIPALMALGGFVWARRRKAVAVA
jgi:LPXTG-motif cell wall-anchored protein